MVYDLFRAKVGGSSDSSMYLGNILNFKYGIYKNRLVSKKAISFSIFWNDIINEFRSRKLHIKKL